MAKLGDTARFKDDADEVKLKAWTVWDRARQFAEKKGGESLTSALGVQGLRMRYSMGEIIRQQYPESRHYNAEDWRNFSGAIMNYLRATHNAVCEKTTPPVVWWVSKVWNDSAAVSTHGPDPRREAERKLTPHEAGEDRAPADVEVRYRTVHGHSATSEPTHTDREEEPVAAREAPTGELSSPPLPLPERTSPEMAERIRQVLEVATRYGEPLTAIEFAYAMNDVREVTMNDKGHVATEGEVKRIAGGKTTGALEVAVNVGLLKARLETVDERKVRAGFVGQKSWAAGRLAKLYWPTEPVPERKTTELVPGFVLKTKLMPEGISARVGARIREERNGKVLDAICNLTEPATIAQLADTLGWEGRHRVEDAVKDLLEAELIHFELGYRGVRQFFPVDKPFPPESVSASRAPVAASSDVPRLPTGLRGSHRAVLNVLRSSPVPMTTRELGEASGYSPSHCHDVVRLNPTHVYKAGTRNHFHLYGWIGKHDATPEPAPTPAPEQPVTTTTAPAPAPAPVPAPQAAAPVPSPASDPRVLVMALASSLGITLEDTARVQELEAEVAALNERLARAQAKIDALSRV